MVGGLGPIVDLITRLQQRLIDSDVALDRSALERMAPAVARTDAPLATDEDIVAVVDGLVGLGPIEPLLRDPNVTDVFVNSPSEVWVERSGQLHKTAVQYPDSAAIVAAAHRVIAPLGLRLDPASPMVDARLADGSRLHAAVPPVAVDGPIMAIRRFTSSVPSLETLVEAGSMTELAARYLADAVRLRRNVLVCGGTGAGKTTLLNVLSHEIPTGERLVVVEDASELRLSGHVVRLEARAANSEGRGAIALDALIRSALRLRPDRIVVGEVRGPEALDLINAINTGHDGSMSTVHANGAADALARLETLALSGARRVEAASLRTQLWSAFEVVVHMTRVGGTRRLAGLFEIDGASLREVAPC